MASREEHHAAAGKDTQVARQMMQSVPVRHELAARMAPIPRELDTQGCRSGDGLFTGCTSHPYLSGMSWPPAWPPSPEKWTRRAAGAVAACLQAAIPIRTCQA